MCVCVCAHVRVCVCITYTHAHAHIYAHKCCSSIAILKSGITVEYSVVNFSHGYSSTVNTLMRNLAGILAIMTLNVPYNGNI